MSDMLLPPIAVQTDPGELTQAIVELLDVGEQMLVVLATGAHIGPTTLLDLETVLLHTAAWQRASRRLAHLLDAELHSSAEDPA